jgi:hypothetical protein
MPKMVLKGLSLLKVSKQDDEFDLIHNEESLSSGSIWHSIRKLRMSVLTGTLQLPSDKRVHRLLEKWQQKHERLLLQDDAAISSGILIFNGNSGLGNQLLAFMGTMYLAFRLYIV